MKNTADVAGGKPIVVLLQSISGVSAINPLVAFYNIHGGKREVVFVYFVPDTTQNYFVDYILWYSSDFFIIITIISPLMSPLLGHRPSLWITYKGNGP
jgi:hypothetical protein